MALKIQKFRLLKAAYKLHGRTRVHGMDISIENRKGSYRYWKDRGGEEGRTYMHHSYGYLRRTEGNDGDHLDVYIGPNPESENVYVVNQMAKPNFLRFDEHKVMLGFNTAVEAKRAYLNQYDDPRFFGSMRKMSIEDFKKWAFTKKPSNGSIEV